MPFESFLRRWRLRRESWAAARREEARLAEAIERMVQDSDPLIRSVSGYRKRLNAPVARALAYIDALVAAVPGPVNLSAAHWEATPLLRALFLKPEEADAFVRGSAEVKAHFDRRPSASEAIAILTATQQERTVFVGAIEGEILRRDVPQVAVDFVALRLVAPAESEPEARRELKVRTLQLLAAHALKEMVARRAVREDLGEQRRILEIKLKIQQTRTDRLECALGGERCGDERKPAPGAEVLAEIDRRLADLAPDKLSAAAHLDRLAEVLDRPDTIMTARAFALNLDWMGVKQAPAAGDPDRAILLAEVQLEDRFRRVAVLVRIPRPAPG